MESLFAIDHSYLIPLLPLLGAAIAGFLGARWLKGLSHWPIWLGVGASAVLSIMLLLGMIQKFHGADEQNKAISAKVLARQTPDREKDHVSSTVTPSEWDKGAKEWKWVSKEPAVAEKSIYVRPARELTGQSAASVDWYTWIQAGSFKATAGFFFDSLTATMLCVVTGIGFLITVFAAGYMKGEEGYFRFFAYLGLFIFAMTILVMGNNFIMLYLGWEGVGLCSYLLVGYYYERPAAREAAKKAFLVNRIGDFGFGLGIMLIYTAFGTVSYYGDASQPGALFQALGPNLTGFQQTAMQWIPFLLMVGAFGKSAQFPLYVWLPDAMEGPTPVSALIHAATMVTAGVYMIVRCSTLFVTNDAAMWTIAIIGAFTALFAASIALRQFDLKKVFAYSTISQLGFMFVAVGVLAPVAGMFHLVTHAFFKALLFLASGVVMHAMLGHLDMRKMSGLKRVLPMTRWMMLAGCLALAGMFPLAGFFSKDEIIVAAWDRNRFLGLVMMFTALLTAYYTFRLYFRVFEGPTIVPEGPAAGHAHTDHGAGDEHAHASASAVQSGDVAESGVDRQLASPAHHAEEHDDHGHHNHEPAVMMLPLVVLTIGAIFSGMALAWWAPLGRFIGRSPSLVAGYALASQHYDPAKLGEPEPALEEGHRRVISEEAWGHEFAENLGQRREEHKDASHTYLPAVSVMIALLGILLAYLFHLKDRSRGERLAAAYPQITRLLEAKYWVDEIYQAAIVEPLRALGRGFFWIDRMIIDGAVWTVSFVPQLGGFALKLTAQRGSLQGYALMMLLSIAAILLILFL
jgi:NADH-quinone oxidoreductase subunit L